MNDLSTLDRFKPSVVAVITETGFADRREPITPQGMSDGTLISFDQSLANTGYVVLDYDSVVGISILEMDVIHTMSRYGNKSWEDTLDRCTQLLQKVLELLLKFRPTLILHEVPPVGRGMYRAESSTVTATVIRCVGYSEKIPVSMVSAQRVKKCLTGDGNAKKRLVREALEKRFEVQLKTPGLKKTEHGFDALGIIVTFLEDLSKYN